MEVIQSLFCFFFIKSVYKFINFFNYSCSHNQVRLEKPCSEEPLKVYPLPVNNHLNDRKLSTGDRNSNSENETSEKYVAIMTHE